MFAYGNEASKERMEQTKIVGDFKGVLFGMDRDAGKINRGGVERNAGVEVDQMRLVVLNKNVGGLVVDVKKAKGVERFDLVEQGENKAKTALFGWTRGEPLIQGDARDVLLDKTKRAKRFVDVDKMGRVRREKQRREFQFQA